MGGSKNRAQQFADLDGPLPKDFDPEEDAAQHSEDGSRSEDSDDGLAGTEHYASIGKSKLRKPQEVSLGPQYAGSRISRDALLKSDDEGDDENEDEDSKAEDEDDEEGMFAGPEDVDLDVDEDDGEIDSDEAFGESDAEKFEEIGFTFRGSGKPKEVDGKKRRPTASDFMSDSDQDPALHAELSKEDGTDEDILDVDVQNAEELEEESSDEATDEDSNEESAPEDEEMDDESESEDEDEDDEKSRRAELRKIMNEEQKSVVNTISKAAKVDANKGNAVLQQRKIFDSLLSVRMALQKGLAAANSVAANEENDTEDAAQKLPYQAAEDAAIKLWNSLDGLRQELIKSNGPNIGQKRKRGINTSTPSSTIWERMQDLELASLDNRQTTLEKWSNKVKDTTALPLFKKLKTTQPQSKVALLQDQVAKKVQKNDNNGLFDDSKFYKTLLNTFVDQRRMDTASTLGRQTGGPVQFTVVKEAKMRKKVDTKASKGRKMRFTVHEKLQNLMAPEDRGSWEPEAIDRFFGTLLGQKMTLGEDDVEEEDDEIPLEDQGLMLFRS